LLRCHVLSLTDQYGTSNGVSQKPSRPCENESRRVGIDRTKGISSFFHGLVEKKSPVITAVASRPAIPARIGRDPARFPRPDRRHHRLDAGDVERPPQVVGDCLLASAGTFAMKAARPRQSSADNYAAVHHFS
jgi:hypothetical protein